MFAAISHGNGLQNSIRTCECHTRWYGGGGASDGSPPFIRFAGTIASPPAPQVIPDAQHGDLKIKVDFRTAPGQPAKLAVVGVADKHAEVTPAWRAPGTMHCSCSTFSTVVRMGGTVGVLGV